MLYSAIDIANYFVNRAIEAGRPLTPMQVLKLTFLAHGWNLGLNEMPLINEPVQAWKCGPVIPSVYFAFQPYGKDPIDKAAKDFFEKESEIESNSSLFDADTETKSLLEKIYEEYSGYDGSDLSKLTHMNGSPWEITVRPYKGKELPRFLTIKNALIQDYYGQRARANEQASKH